MEESLSWKRSNSKLWRSSQMNLFCYFFDNILLSCTPMEEPMDKEQFFCNDIPHVSEYSATSVKSRYHSYELETLIMTKAVKYFRNYLVSREFVVYTDCNSIKAYQLYPELAHCQYLTKCTSPKCIKCIFVIGPQNRNKYIPKLISSWTC